MNYDIIKKIYEKIPKRIKYAFSPIFIRFIISNPIFRKTYNDLCTFEKLTSENQLNIQFELLKEIIIYAYENTSYYKNLLNNIDLNPYKIKSVEEVKRIPLLTKDLAIEHASEIYSSEKIDYFESITGGSSGRALKVLLDKDSIYKERAFICHYLSKYGYDYKKSRTLAFWGHNKDTDYYYSPLKNEIVISPFKLFDELGFDNVWKAIENFKPEFISGYPSAINLFVQLMEKHNKFMQFKLVDFYAENHTTEMKEYIEKTLNCKAVSNYGHTERAVFAELYDTGYLFNKLYGYTELLPTENDDEFQIVCTGFISHKMPLIRYVTDDIAKIDSYGNIKIQGHKFSEVQLIGKNGAKIFKGALTLHIEVFKKVRQYQYVQYQKGKAFLDLVLAEKLNDNDIKEILLYLDKRCEGLLDVELRFVDSIELTRRGKYNWAVNHIQD